MERDACESDACESDAWETGAQAWIARVATADWSAHDASVRELLPPPGGTALDVGCGEGRLTRLLRSLGHDAIGVDRSATLVAHARHLDPAGRYEIAPVEALPVPDGSASLVLCVNVLPHVDDLDAAARELARVAAPGGVLVVGQRHPLAEAAAGNGYFAHERHAVPLGDGVVCHRQRTVERLVRAFRAARLELDDLREVPDGDGAPAFLDLRLLRPRGPVPAGASDLG